MIVIGHFKILNIVRDNLAKGITVGRAWFILSFTIKQMCNVNRKCVATGSTKASSNTAVQTAV